MTTTSQASFFGYPSTTPYSGGGFIDFPVIGDGTISADIDMNNYKVKNLGAPISPNDAVSRQYVDSAISAIEGASSVTVSGNNAQSAPAPLTGALPATSGLVLLISAKLVATTNLSCVYRVVVDTGTGSLATEQVGSPNLGISFYWTGTGLAYTSGTYSGFSSLTFEYKLTSL